MSICARRRRRLRDWLQEHEQDAFIVSAPVNVRYLLGFAGEGLAVVGLTDVYLCTDRRYEIDAHEVPGRIKILTHEDGHLGGVVEALGAMKASRVAFDAESLLYASYDYLQSKLDGVALKPTGRVVEDFRVRKSAEELEAMRRAAAITDQALQSVLAALEPGCTEREVAADLIHAALRAGADSMAFPPIVAFGPNAACPHAVPGDARLEQNQMVKIDCGARVEGYCADITRTVFVGEPDEQYTRIYRAVRTAQQVAVEETGPGIEIRDVDAAARCRLMDHDLGEYFTHGTGHGVGLQVHEQPSVNGRSRSDLEPGMVITVEPGVYIEGWGGVRIEDTVLITRGGHEVLTSTPKQDI